MKKSELKIAEPQKNSKDEQGFFQVGEAFGEVYLAIAEMGSQIREGVASKVKRIENKKTERLNAKLKKALLFSVPTAFVLFNVAAVLNLLNSRFFVIFVGNGLVVTFASLIVATMLLVKYISERMSEGR